MTKTKIDTIIICSAGDVITGGVNSLHNLCKSLQQNGFNAVMYYFNPDETILNNHQITSYEVPRIYELHDQPNNLIVVPETLVSYLLQFKQAKKMVYWLGLNYFFKNPDWRFPFNIKLFRKLISCRSYAGYSSGLWEESKRKLNEFAKSHFDMWNDEVIHLSNSYFVADYCQRKGSQNSFVLHNPIRQEFYDHQPNFSEREKLILFGPKTPQRIINKLKKRLPDFSIIRLKKLPLKKVHDLMSKAVIFAEFGNYSGRDRMPREAVMLGCNIFMNTRGTAAFENDFKIPRKYTIADSPENIPYILEQLTECAVNYNEYKSDFDEFREQLKLEQQNFISNTQKVFQQIL